MDANPLREGGLQFGNSRIVSSLNRESEYSPSFDTDATIKMRSTVSGEMFILEPEALPDQLDVAAEAVLDSLIVHFANELASKQKAPTTMRMENGQTPSGPPATEGLDP